MQLLFHCTPDPLNSKATLNEVRQMRDEAKTVADQTATSVVEAALDRLTRQISATGVEKEA